MPAAADAGRGGCQQGTGFRWGGCRSAGIITPLAGARRKGRGYAEQMPLPPLVEPVAALSDAEQTRTLRHAVLNGFGELGQRRLAAGHVAVVGAGGLGSPVLLALAAAGVGTITIVDDDLVEATNLQRQVVHRTSDVGSPKVDSAVRVAADLSPETRVRTIRERLTGDNAATLLDGADVVIDGTDTFATRRAVASACERLGVPLVWGVLQEFHAQITVFWSAPPAGAPAVVLDDLYPPDSVGEVPSCAQVGVLGALCLQAGGILAGEAIKLLTGIGEPLLGRVLVIDALRARTSEVPLRPSRTTSYADDRADAGATASVPDTAPATASVPDTAPATASAPDASGVAARPASVAARTVTPTTADRKAPPVHFVPSVIPQLTPAETRDAQAAGATLLDVREPVETAAGVIAGSVLVPLGYVLNDPAAVSASLEGPVVVVCKVGARAQHAAAALRAVGLDAAVLAGGIEAWNRETAG